MAAKAGFKIGDRFKRVLTERLAQARAAFDDVVLPHLRTLSYGTFDLHDASTSISSRPSALGNAFILDRIPDVDVAGGHLDLLAYLDSDPDSAFAHRIAGLAATLTEGLAGEGRVVTLFPLGAGEGATSLAMCLAQAAINAGRRVLLIDADSSGHGLSNELTATGLRGLAEVVAGQVSANRALVRRPPFLLLPVGRKAISSATEIEALGTFLTETRSRFDLVLIDAPIFDSTELSMGLATQSDGFAFVVTPGQLLRETFIPAIDRVAAEPGFAGLILNRTIAAQAADLDVSDLAAAS